MLSYSRRFARVRPLLRSRRHCVVISGVASLRVFGSRTCPSFRQVPRTCRARSLLKGLRLRSNRRAAGAPLTVILPGETMPGTEDGPPAAFAWRGAGCCVTAGHHRSGGSGDGRPASARRAPQRPHARGRGLSRRPGRGRSPAFPPPSSAWWCYPSKFTLSRSAISRFPAMEPG